MSDKISSDKENSRSTAEGRTKRRVTGAGASARGGDCFDASRRSTSADSRQNDNRDCRGLSHWLKRLLWLRILGNPEL